MSWFGILYDMTVKREVGDAGTFLWAVAVALVAAALVYWRYRVALAQGPPAEPSAS
jgi:hypothetical protein